MCKILIGDLCIVNIKRAICLLTLFLIICGFNISTNFVYQSLDVKVRFTKRIKIPFIVDGLKIEFFIPDNYTNGINIQKITSSATGNILGGSYTKKIITDKYGNKKLRIEFTNPVNEVFIDYAFTFSSRVTPTSNNFPSRYPLSAIKLNKFRKYLLPTNKTQLGNIGLQSIVKLLVKNQNNVYQVALRILSWIQKNIIHYPSVRYDDGLTTFLNKRGNYKGILNLALIMMRLAKLPARAVKGICINKQYYYKNNNTILMNYPKGYHSWIEVFFPSRSWVPFDLFSSYFFIPDNMVRLGCGADTEEIQDIQVFTNGYTPLSNESFFFEGYNKAQNVNTVSNTNDPNKIIVIPPGRDADFIKSINQTIRSAIIYKGRYFAHQDNLVTYPVFDFIYHNIINQPYEHRVQIKISKDTKYAQCISIDQPLFLDYITVPLYVSGIYSSKIWVDIYEDDNGKPGKFYVRSYINNINVKKRNNPILHKFFFNRNRWPYLQKKKYWFIVKTNDSGQIFWYGIIGNPLNDQFDTKTSYANDWDTICHFDLMLKLFGNYNKRP